MVKYKINIDTDLTDVPGKVHTRQLVKIQPDEKLATTSELKPHTPSGNRTKMKMGRWNTRLQRK